MKKRLTALLLCLLLSLGLVAGALAGEMSEEQKVDRLAQLMRDYVEQEALTTAQYDSGAARYKTLFALDSALGQCEVYTNLYYDMLSVQAIPGLRVPEQYRDNMAKLLTLINSGIYYSYFQMDYDSGRIISRGMQLVEEVFPTTSEIDVLHYMAVFTLDDWGNAITQVAGGADVLDSYTKALAELELKD